MSSPLPARITPVERVRYDDAEDQRLFEANLAEAAAYIGGFAWYPGAAQVHLGAGVPGVLMAFLFELARPIDEDRALWVVVGDLPSAYFVTDAAPDPIAAIEVYTTLMQDWVDAVRSGTDLSEVFPVEAAPTREHADMLDSRLAHIRSTIIPALREDPMPGIW